MSMHKIPLTRIEESGLLVHGLDMGKPSQLSDAFRQGVAWGQKAERESWLHECEMEYDVETVVRRMGYASSNPEENEMSSPATINCQYCNGEGSIEMDNNGPIVSCPVCEGKQVC